MSFPHHTYQNDPAAGRFELIPPEVAKPIDDPTAADIPGIPGVLRTACVRKIVLIHGTFAGDDALGIIREVSRLVPRIGRAMKRASKQIVDQLAGDLGNYTEGFAKRLRQLVNADQTDEIDVSLFHWSGENHHLGRAEGAVTLLDQLMETAWNTDDRILFWSHSHAGNLLALLTNLLGADDAGQAAFFNAARSHYRVPIGGTTDVPAWVRVRERLQSAESWVPPNMDIVNFGTPIRYRWNTEVCAGLLHFVHHRPLIDGAPAQAHIPTTFDDVKVARGGDYGQQIGIAGTNFLHYLGAWRSWRAEMRLSRLLQTGVRKRDVIQNLKKGHRVSLDGTTLLVDYGPSKDGWEKKLAGHAVYTRHEWLPFHLREIADRFYGQPVHET